MYMETCTHAHPHNVFSEVGGRVNLQGYCVKLVVDVIFGPQTRASKQLLVHLLGTGKLWEKVVPHWTYQVKGSV